MTSSFHQVSMTDGPTYLFGTGGIFNSHWFVVIVVVAVTNVNSWNTKNDKLSTQTPSKDIIQRIRNTHQYCNVRHLLAIENRWSHEEYCRSRDPSLVNLLSRRNKKSETTLLTDPL